MERLSFLEKHCYSSNGNKKNITVFRRGGFIFSIVLRKWIIVTFFIYLSTVLWYTVLKRSTGSYMAEYELFWSYRKWFDGNWRIGRQILQNIAMFLPFGFLFSIIFYQFWEQKRKQESLHYEEQINEGRVSIKKRRIRKLQNEYNELDSYRIQSTLLYVALGAFLFSAMIEVLQLWLVRGFF